MTSPPTGTAAGLVKLALAAGCRPHLDASRSPHGRAYRVMLWHSDPQLLHGAIDVSEVTGRFAAAWLQWGDGDERRTTDPGEVRAALTSCRDLHNPPPAVRRRRAGMLRAQADR